jgi:predicted AAA+ superfamily ATPase
MREEPVVILTGPRTVGKSTLLAALAAESTGPSSTLTAQTRERQQPATPA